jgi:spore maturation protein CgeB
MNILIIQENGRHDANRSYRECFCTKRAIEYHGHTADVWGLGHENYNQIPDWQSYDLIINLENYDETGWVPNLSKIQTSKFLWSIDAHVKGINSYIKTANEGNYDLILQATPEFVADGSIWFPNCYDDTLIKPLNVEKKYDVGFCGNINNRGALINIVNKNFNFKLDEFVIGDSMVEAINSYKIHFNANISIDINYRNFETIGCGTCLLTSKNKHYNKLGFIDGENCLIYESIEQMMDKIRWALQNQDKLKQISENGVKLAEFHSFKERIKFLINFIGKYKFAD